MITKENVIRLSDDEYKKCLEYRRYLVNDHYRPHSKLMEELKKLFGEISGKVVCPSCGNSWLSVFREIFNIYEKENEQKTVRKSKTSGR